MSQEVQAPSPLEQAMWTAVEGARGRSALAWFAPERAGATAWFAACGFPGRKDEAWRFTSVRDLARIPFAPAEPLARDRLELAERAGLVEGHGAGRIVIANGHPSRWSAAAAGVDVQRFSADAGDGASTLRAHLGRHATVEHAFSALNTALFEDGLLIRVRPGVRAEAPLELIFASHVDREPTVDHARVLIVVERGAQLHLVESHVELPPRAAPFLSSAVLEIVLEREATLDHLRVVRGSPGGHRVALTAVSQDRGSRYTSRVLTFGGALSRHDLGVRLEGEDASATLDGFYLAQRTEQVDHHTVIDHVAPHCSSAECYRGIVDDRGRAVFDGTVRVRRGARRTAAHQENHNLVLSAESAVHTKPHLEIDHDDVRCSHGASVGYLDREQVFYLRSRGLSEEGARRIIAQGFAAAVFDGIANPALREVLRGELRSRFAGRQVH